MTKYLTILLLSLTLMGCAAKDKVTAWFKDGEEGKKPTQLVRFEPTLAVKKLWSKKVGSGTDKLYLKLSPAATDTAVFIANRDGYIAALTRDAGKTLWKRKTKKPISGGPGLGEDRVYVGTSDGEVLALTQADGQIVWMAQVSSEVLAAPKAAKGVVVVRTGDGKLFGFSSSDGKRRWVHSSSEPVLTLRGTSAPLVTDDLVIAGFDNGRLVALNLSSGKVVWETRVAIPRGRTDLERMVDIDSEPLLMGSNVYVATFQGHVAAHSLDSGQSVWAREMSSYAGIGLDNNHVYLADEESNILALDRFSGNSEWKQEALKGRSVTAPATTESHIIVGDFQGYLHWMDWHTGTFAARVKVDNSRILAPPLVVNGTVLVYSSKGTLVAYRAE